MNKLFPCLGSASHRCPTISLFGQHIPSPIANILLSYTLAGASHHPFPHCPFIFWPAHLIANCCPFIFDQLIWLSCSPFIFGWHIDCRDAHSFFAGAFNSHAALSYCGWHIQLPCRPFIFQPAHLIVVPPFHIPAGEFNCRTALWLLAVASSCRTAISFLAIASHCHAVFPFLGWSMSHCLFYCFMAISYHKSHDIFCAVASNIRGTKSHHSLHQCLCCINASLLMQRWY